MNFPKVRDEGSVNSPEGSRQAVKSNEAAGARIKSALDGREVSWLVRETGYGDSTIRDALRRGPVRSDVAMAIANALGVSVDWLLSGTRSNVLVAAEDADWVELPEYAMMEFNETGKLEPIATAMIRRDWLQASLGEAHGLWIARLPAPYDALALHRGEPIICTDHRAGDRMIDGTHYLFWVNGGIVMAPFARREGAPGDRAVLARDIGRDEDQFQPVARVIGVLARPI